MASAQLPPKTSEKTWPSHGEHFSTHNVTTCTCGNLTSIKNEEKSTTY